MGRTRITAFVLVLLTASLLTTSALAGGGKEGWGGAGGFVGRYQVKILAAGGSGVRGGELTMFIQEEFPGSEEPAGILKLSTKTNNDVVYLKELKHLGTARTATVKGGSFLGPTIGSFRGRVLAAGRIRATVSTKGLGRIRAVFTRYSNKPTR